MAAMTTVLTEFSNNGDSRTSTLTGHVATSPRIVIEKRKVPEGNQTMIEYDCKIVYATVDDDGVALSNKVSFDLVVRYPIAGQVSDLLLARAILADIVAGDEFIASIQTQNWLT